MLLNPGTNRDGRDKRDLIAIVGMAGRFPGARNVSQLWANICAGVESVQLLSKVDLIRAGATSESLSNPAHVPACAAAEGLDRFDAGFFLMSRRDAELMDPQLRVALETVWEALEDAGMDPSRDKDGLTGVFMGASLSSYLFRNLLPNQDLIDRIGAERLLLLNDKDFYSTTISYKFNLRGPSISVGTACSSSLVATHLACQSLWSGECRVAIAGGSSVHVPIGRGYRYTKEGIYSPDGHCRPFDSGARGTVGGDGAAFVVLKRYQDALLDGDRVHALIRGSAINNDGAVKAGYTAPSVDSQCAVIEEALKQSGISAREIGYVEAHGTGTILGDPIEVAALNQAFKKHTGDVRYCALGSLKANIGHLDTAAGVAGLIKAACAVRDGLVPPAVNFDKPNVEIDFTRSPFFVSSELQGWPASMQPRRAGVSAFGVGGTNAHLILEEAPAVGHDSKASQVGPWILPISARDERDLQAALHRLGGTLDADRPMADVELTWAIGRKQFPARRALVVTSREDFARQIVSTTPTPTAGVKRLLLFAPPAGLMNSQIGHLLFTAHSAFHDSVVECLDSLSDRLCADRVRRSFDPVSTDIHRPVIDPVRAFIVQYGLVRMFTHWGVKPDRVLGLEVGDLVARCVDGPLSLVQAIGSAERLGPVQPSVRSMIVKLSERDLVSILPRDIRIVAVCSPEVCIISGSATNLERLHPVLSRSGVACRWMNYQILGEGQTEQPKKTDLADAIRSAAAQPGIWLEVGLDRMLTGLLRRNRVTPARRLRGLPSRGAGSESGRVLEWLGALWEEGFEVNWSRFVEGRGGRRCSLPTYPFKPERYWVDPPEPEAAAKETVQDIRVGDKVLGRLEEAIEKKRGAPCYMPMELRRELDSLSTTVIAEYLLAHGVHEKTSWDFEALSVHLGVLSQFKRGLRYYIDVLRQDGLASGTLDRPTFVNLRPHRMPVAEQCQLLRTKFPQFSGLIDLVAHCASHLAESLSTPYGGINTLYPKGSESLIRHFIDNTVQYGAQPLCIELLCRWVSEEWLPSRRDTVRILEVGMGGGILTWNLAPVLNGARVEYVATDVSKAMLSTAQRRATKERVSCITFQPYDLRRAPSEQGLLAGSFDLILALDVLHILPNLQTALAHLRQLLTPEGILGIVESTNLDRWPNLVWGLSDGWWAFEDRKQTPLLSASEWVSILPRSGLRDLAVGPVRRDDHTDCVLLLGGVEALEPSGVGPNPPPKREDIDTWFYQPVWRPWAPEKRPISSRKRWLLFANEGRIAKAFEQALYDSNSEVVVVRRDAKYMQLGLYDYRIRADCQRDYDVLMASVLQHGAIDGILHAWTIEGPIRDALDGLESDQNEGIHSLLMAMQTLGRHNVTVPIRLGILTSNTAEVLGGDLLNPNQATLKGAAKVIPQEYPNIRCVHLDVDARMPWKDDDARRIVEVFQCQAGERFIAYRDKQLFKLEAEQVRTSDCAGNTKLRPGGVYLITGGLGGVGLTLAEHLAKEVKARLVLVGRTGLPPRSEWLALSGRNDAIGEQLRRVQLLEELGAEVMIQTADVADRNSIERVVREAEERFGPIHGVIHSAAVADTSGVIQRRSRTATERAMAAKVRGTLVLDSVLRDHTLDFFVLCSALGATIYNLKFGEVAYVAANDFLNAYSHYLRTTRGVNSITISWTDWNDVGMAADALKRLGASRGDFEEVEHSFWERRQTKDHKARYLATVLAAGHWLFYGHRIGGRATLPGVALIDLTASAFCLTEGATACQIRSLYVLTPISVEDWSRAELALTIDAARNGSSRCELRMVGDGGEEREHASAWVEPLDELRKPSSLSIAEVQARCERSIRFEAGQWCRGAESIKLDPRWDAVREVWIGNGEGLARLEAGQNVRDELRAFKWHPALLDSAVGFLNHLIVEGTGALYLPVGYERVRLWAPLEPVIFSHGRWQMTTGKLSGTLRFDFTITDAAGRVLMEIDGLTAIRESESSVSSSSHSAVTHQLKIARPGLLTTLGFRKTAAAMPQPGHVEIEVMAAGLNFKEVLTGLGLMGDELSFGLECSGRVRRVGDGVNRFRGGEKVVAFGINWTMPFVSVPEAWVESFSDSLSFEEAATMPVAFVIAHYGLRKLAQLREGESVLIHSACGGVGLAAVQIARGVGAKIIATAGSESKREFLKQNGIEHVSNSRTGAFLEDSLRWTNGRGVDCVLNSLGGELLDKGLEALAPRGRFVELGLRDLQENRRIGLRLLAKGVQFLPVLPDPRNIEFVTAWREVCQFLREGRLTPLPFRVFPVGRITDAFEQMSRGEHIGKLVVVSGGEYPPVPSSAKTREANEKDAIIRSLVQGMTPEEGVAAFRRALSAALPEILVSTQDMQAMLDQQEIVSKGGHEAFWTARTPQVDALPKINGKPKAIVESDVDGDINETLAAVWRDLLGVNEIAPGDDFFDLGGDSLLAIRMIAKMKDVFDVDQTLAGFFDASTFQQVSDSVRIARAKQVRVP